MRFRPSRLVAALVRHVCRSVLRALVTALIFLTCAWAALAGMGVPLPGWDELLERFESVSQLSGILS